MGKLLALIYGLACYLLAVGTILYAIGFEENFLVPKGVDFGTVGDLGQAILINVALLGLFVVQHTVMARPGFKEKWTRIVPKTVERSTYVLFATAVFALFLWQWRPVDAGVVWSVDGAGGQVLWALNWVGWAVFFWSTFLIDHFELFGVKQVWNNMRGVTPPPMAFKTPVLYKLCRHPMMLGFLIAFWATPHMTVTHLFLTVAITGYIFIGIWFEERDLVQALGARYQVYQKQMPMVLPFGQRKSPQEDIHHDTP